jgi:hypothetical protein
MADALDTKIDHKSAFAGTNDLLSMLSEEVVDSFSPEQRAALWAASHAISWRRHPVNIRLSGAIPFGPRVFFTGVGGANRRSKSRNWREKRTYPFLTPGNVLFVCVILAACLVLDGVLIDLVDKLLAARSVGGPL